MIEIKPQFSTGNVKSGNDKPLQRLASLLAIDDLVPASHNTRKHSRAQIRAIAKSIEAFGRSAPILLERNQIVNRQCRPEVVKLLSLPSSEISGESDG
jgi:hypothetical protein